MAYRGCARSGVVFTVNPIHLETRSRSLFAANSCFPAHVAAVNAVTAIWLTLLALILCGNARQVGGQETPPISQGQLQRQASKAKAAAEYGKLRLSFVANQGQADSGVRFLAQGRGYSLALTGSAAELNLQTPSKSQNPSARTQVRMELTGANHRATVTGENPLPSRVNYFIGNDPTRWRTDVPTYARVRYSGVYPGIDLVYYGNQGELEYDFVVAANANPDRIRMQFGGAGKLKLTAGGDLTVSAEDGDIVFHKPVIYQQRNGRRQTISGRFTLLTDNQAGFALGGYDHSQPLILDPVLVYSTYIGGSGFPGDQGNAIAVDKEGNAYITGSTNSADFPVTQGAYRTTDPGSQNGANVIFVTKLNPSGTGLVYSTYIGGTWGDYAQGLAVDGSGNAYLAGYTYSPNYPVTTGAFQTTNIGWSHSVTSAIVTKLNASGNALVYSTYLGGTGAISVFGDEADAVAVDSNGNAYIAGKAYSSDFPVTTGAFQTKNKSKNDGSNAFLTKLNPAGSGLVFSTYLGGSGITDVGDEASALALDNSGNIYLTGYTYSSDFPVTTGAFQTTNKGTSQQGYDAFVAKMNSTGSALLYSTYLGGNGIAGYGDRGYGIAVDGSGSAYITGEANSSNFPVTLGAFQTSNYGANGGNPTVFVTKLNATGSGLTYSTYLGGSSEDSANAVALDGSGNIYAGGSTYSSDFPVTVGALQTTNGAVPVGSYTAFVTKINPEGSRVLYSTFLGGSGTDSASGLALDVTDNLYVIGTSYSTDFPVTKGAFQTTNRAAGNNGTNLFVTKLDLNPPATATTTTLIASANPQTKGIAVTFSATVTAQSGAAIPTGSVVFSVDGTTAATITLSSAGKAAYSTSTLAVGNHTIKAAYGGSASFTSSSASLTETIKEPQAAAPVFSPAVGTYDAAQSVTLSDKTTGAAIYFTTNGTTPTTASTKYTSAINVSKTTTIKAIAAASGYLNSVAATGTYTITPPAPMPTFSPAAGTYHSAQSVKITDTATTGLVIYYTTNGTVPTTSSTKYTGAISVSTTETLEAIAVATGYSKSAVASAKYTLVAAIPTFRPVAGTYHSAQSVTIADATPGATIYYTTNGTTPTTSSTKYTAPITVSKAEKIEAIAVAAGYENSAVATATYAFQVATPTFSPAGGTYSSPQSVTIKETTPGATIYYTTNGTTPTTSSTKYTAPIPVSKAEKIEAIAVAAGYANSAVATATYAIN